MWSTTFNIDYHVEVEGHYYSVPYPLVHESVDSRSTLRTIEILHQGKRVASHARSFAKGQHTTATEHMPESHRRHVEWTPARMVQWAKNAAGPATAELFEAILRTRPHPEQGYRSCLGVLRLGHKHGCDRLEAASRRALQFRTYSYASVKSILRSGLDRAPIEDASEELASIRPLPRSHKNVRGARSYT